VATFLVERYWPGVTAVAAEAATAALGGTGMEVVETIVTASDEVCFWYVEAASENEIKGAFDSVGVPIDRISPATALPDSSEARRPTTATASAPAPDAGTARAACSSRRQVPQSG
jgi:hypothetical protein